MSKVPLAICPQRSFAEDHTVLRPMLGVWECLSSQIKLAPKSQLGCLVQRVEKCWRLKLQNICEAKIRNRMATFMHQNAFYIYWLSIFTPFFQFFIFGFSCFEFWFLVGGLLQAGSFAKALRGSWWLNADHEDCQGIPETENRKTWGNGSVTGVFERWKTPRSRMLPMSCPRIHPRMWPALY